MANDLVVGSGKTYGGLKPAGTLGADEFAAHDATKSWSDQGASAALINAHADRMVDQLGAEVARYGAEQVRTGIIDYLTSAYSDTFVVNRVWCWLLDGSNNEASLGVFWKIPDMGLKSISEAYAASDWSTLDAIRECHSQWGAALEGVFRDDPRDLPAPAAYAAGRPLRAGNLKPAPVRGGRTGSGRPGAASDAPEHAPPPPAVPRPQRPGAAHNARVAATPPRPSS